MSANEILIPVIAFPDGGAFAAWIERQGADCPGVWVKFAKKTSGVAGISQQEAWDVALCHGWIDGQRKGFDATYYLNKYTPRRARSKWSEINRKRALELIGEGRMTQGGLAEIERAKADGRWDAAAAPPRTWTAPDDLREALAGNAAAKALFSELDSRNRVAILLGVRDAKKAETRAARIKRYVAMLAKGETPYPRRTARVARMK